MAADVDVCVSIVKTTVDRLVTAWPQVQRDCPIPEFVAAHIEERLRKLPLVEES
jgi:serine/threonine-protein kinase HipA